MAQPAPLFRDDFHLKENNFSMPENTIPLDRGIKRERGRSAIYLFTTNFRFRPSREFLTRMWATSCWRFLSTASFATGVTKISCPLWE